MFTCENLCKAYAGRQILTGVSFSLPAGHCLGVTGENGSGKSTLLRLLAQIEPPDGGRILFAGQPVLKDRKFLREHMGYVPQSADLQPGLTVQMQLKLWLRACGKSGELPGDILELCGLAPILKKSVSTLSGGTRKRVSIAMALSSRPDILLMDEATAGLDAQYRDRLLQWLEDFLARGGRMVWCTHHKEELERLCGGQIHLPDCRNFENSKGE